MCCERRYTLTKPSWSFAFGVNKCEKYVTVRSKITRMDDWQSKSASDTERQLLLFSSRHRGDRWCVFDACFPDIVSSGARLVTLTLLCCWLASACDPCWQDHCWWLQRDVPMWLASAVWSAAGSRRDQHADHLLSPCLVWTWEWCQRRRRRWQVLWSAGWCWLSSTLNVHCAIAVDRVLATPPPRLGSLRSTTSNLSTWSPCTFTQSSSCIISLSTLTRNSGALFVVMSLCRSSWRYVFCFCCEW